MDTDLRTAIVLVCIASILAIVMRLRHNYVKKWRRRCICCRDVQGNPTGGEGIVCGGFTHREYRMVPDESRKPSRFGEWFIWFVFDVCDVCGHVRLIKGGANEAKFFHWWKLLWRRLTDPKQFRSAEDLLVRAGLLKESIRSTAERLRNHAEENMKQFTGPRRAVLNLPPENVTPRPPKKPGLHILQALQPPRRFDGPKISG